MNYHEKHDGLYDEFLCRIYTAPLNGFNSLLEFCSKIPEEETGPFEQAQAEWMFKKLPKSYKLSEIADPEYGPYKFLRGEAGLGRVIKKGFLLSEENGRVDKDITFITRVYLLQTDQCYAYLYYDDQILH